MFDLMQNILLIFIEAICCKIFFETFGKIRHKGWINIIQVMLLLEKHSDQLKLCAVAFGCQVISEVPRDMHDFLMEYIVTENECLERMVPNDIRDSGNSGKKS